VRSSAPSRERFAMGMRKVARFAALALALIACGAAAVTLTFYLVSRQPEGKLLSANGAVSAPRPEFAPRFGTWLSTVWLSDFSDWGGSVTAPSVSALLRDRLPVTARIGLYSWGLGWTGGLALAMALATVLKRLSRIHLELVYPAVVAIPPLTIVFLFYVCLLVAAPASLDDHAFPCGVGLLFLLVLPTASALWLNGLERVLAQEFVRVARSTGMSPVRLWARHVLPNAFVSSGVLTQAAVSLAGTVAGSFFVEKTFGLGGVASKFLQAVQQGQAELAATAVIIYFVPLALGVTLAEGIVLLLQPEQRGREDAR